MTDDPFERAAAREVELREADVWKDDVVRTARVSTRQTLIAVLVLLPFHLTWDGRTGTTIAVHAGLAAFCAWSLATFRVDRIRHRRPPVYRRGSFNFIIRGSSRGEGW